MDDKTIVHLPTESDNNMDTLNLKKYTNRNSWALNLITLMGDFNAQLGKERLKENSLKLSQSQMNESKRSEISWNM